MHARVSTYQFELDTIDDAISTFESGFEDEGLAAMQEAMILVDRSTGKALTITLWESADAAAASRDAANRARSQAADAVAGSIQSVEEFEVGSRQLRSTARSASV